MTMKTSANGLKKIGQREGVRLKAYKDSKGIWTIGVGHIAGVHEGMKITAAECNKLLADDLRIAEAAVNHSVKVPINQDQFDSLVSLTFNIGVHAFQGSTVLKRLNARNYGGAAQAMMMWTKDVELVPRRQGEVEQFLGAGMAMHPSLMSDYQPQTEEDPSLEHQPTPVVQPINDNPVAASNTFEELRGKLASANDLVSKTQMALDSDVVRVGRRVVKIGVGAVTGLAAAPVATAAVNSSEHGFWSRFFDFINGVPAVVYFGLTLFLVSLLAILGWWAAEKAMDLRKAGRVLPKSEP